MTCIYTCKAIFTLSKCLSGYEKGTLQLSMHMHEETVLLLYGKFAVFQTRKIFFI